MSTTDTALPVNTTIADSNARSVNSQLLQSLITAFAQNPAAYLAALLPSDYHSHTPLRPSSYKKKPESKTAQLNRRTINTLLRQFAKDPAGSIIQETDFPLTYEIQRDESTGKPKDIRIEKPVGLPSDYFTSILDQVAATSFNIAAPLSPEVDAMLRQQRQDDPHDPVSTLKTVIKNSCFLWSGTAGGRFVAKLSDNVAVRVCGGDQTNPYAAYEFLARHAPDIPAPRPHGLIQLGDLSVMFFSYVPGITLEKVWPTLSHEQKTSIQTQLDHIFARVRKIPRNGRPAGMVNGKGVVDLRALMRERHPDKSIETVAEFEEFIFSYRPWVAETYVRFLQDLLPQFRFDEPFVFTHGDVRPANIMVDTNETGDWRVSGIVDWEEAGFYPPYWESVKATRIFLANDESDWYLMLPGSISPVRYRTHWLVDRLWDSTIQILAGMDKHIKKRKDAP